METLEEHHEDFQFLLAVNDTWARSALNLTWKHSAQLEDSTPSLNNLYLDASVFSRSLTRAIFQLFLPGVHSDDES